MSDTLNHRGLMGSVEYSAEDQLLYGKVMGIRGLVSYEGTSIESLQADFRDAVDDFLQDVAVGKAELRIDKPWQIPVTGPMLEATVRYAQQHNVEFGSVVDQALHRFFEAA